MFEDNQADLEQAVEALSELLEKPIEKDAIATLRQQVTDKTVRLRPSLHPLNFQTLTADGGGVGLRPEAPRHLAGRCSQGSLGEPVSLPSPPLLPKIKRLNQDTEQMGLQCLSSSFFSFLLVRV